MIAQTTKYVYFFDEGERADASDLLGGKGAGLAEMTAAGLPVPAGFTITTRRALSSTRPAAPSPRASSEQVDAAMTSWKAHRQAVRHGRAPAARLGAKRRARLDARHDGHDPQPRLNDETVGGLARSTKNERFAWDAYRRFIMMFSSVVSGIEKDHFEESDRALKKPLGVESDRRDRRRLVATVWSTTFKAIVRDKAGREFPQDVREQLGCAIEAVFDSWNSKRAIDYRRFNKISDDWGTAVTVMEMVFGNMGDDSGTGVAFTRDPNTGEQELFGEYCATRKARTSSPASARPRRSPIWRATQPAVYEQFVEIADRLERHYRDMQDIEFTVERGKLFMLQTRSRKRSAEAAVQHRARPRQGRQDRQADGRRLRRRAVHGPALSRAHRSEAKPPASIAKGLNASPGAAAGHVVFDADDAVAWQRSRRGNDSGSRRDERPTTSTA